MPLHPPSLAIRRDGVEPRTGSREMSHVLDDLELYVLGVLAPLARDRVATHLDACAGCRTEAMSLGAVVSALHDALPEREPPLSLRGRILESAAGARSQRVRRLPPLARWAPTAALAAATIALAVMSVGDGRQMQALRAERDDSRAIAERVSRGGRTWYMSGVERWQGAGGMHFAPQESPAYVVFHDLPAVQAGQSYTIWLVDADGRWIRSSGFAPADSAVRVVDVGAPVEGFGQCVVTLETRTTGAPEGPIVMQSRLHPRQ